jgi:hypothetical protein
MVKKPKRFAWARRFARIHKRSLKWVWNAVQVSIFLITVFQLVVGEKFVIVERIHEKTLDLTHAVAHSPVELGFSVSATVTIQRTNGMSYTLDSK